MGLGEILYNGDLVGALYHEDDVKQDRIDEIVSTHKEQMGDEKLELITGSRVTYWFWSLKHPAADDLRLPKKQ